MSNTAFASSSHVDPDLPMTEDGVAYHLSCSAKDIADLFILVGDPARVRFVATFFDELTPEQAAQPANNAEWPKNVTFYSHHREIVIATGFYRGHRVSCVSTGMGTDNVEIVMNEIHALKEFDVATKKWNPSFAPETVKLIRVGTCGSPQSTTPIGALAVTRFAIGMDNTGRYYNALTADVPLHKQFRVDAVKAAVEANTALGGASIGGVYITVAHPDITNGIVSACDAYAALPESERANTGVEGLQYLVGGTATGSGFYGCQGRLVGRLAQYCAAPKLVDELGALSLPVPPEVSSTPDKVVNIEMETSSLCYLSNLLGYKAGSVCVVVARRAGDERAFATPDLAAAAIRAAVQIALNALVSIP